MQRYGLLLFYYFYNFYKDRAFFKLLNILFMQTQMTAGTHTFMKEKGMLFIYLFISNEAKTCVHVNTLYSPITVNV